jgi:O-antigen/teichoic acid export membrane protein
LRWAQRVTMGAACAVTGAGIGVVAVLWALGRSDRQMLIAIGIALLALPWLAFSNLRQGALRGLHRVTLCFVPELLVAPALTLAMLVAAGWLLGTHFKPLHAVAIMAACVVPAYLLGSWLLRRNLPPALTAAPVELHTGAWLRSAVPLMLISALYVMTARADTLLLGAIKGKEAVGLYDVARKLADCISFVLLTVNAVLAPNVARLYAQGAHAQLQRVVTWSARGVTAAALPLALILMFRGAWFLHFFGDKYDGMTSTLIVLCLGQIVNAASGSVGVILATTGHERDAVLGISIGGVLNVVANLVLIPRFSYNGAAWAFLASMITWNGLLAWFVYRRLGLDSTCLGILHRKPAHV